MIIEPTSAALIAACIAVLPYRATGGWSGGDVGGHVVNYKQIAVFFGY